MAKGEVVHRTINGRHITRKKQWCKRCMGRGFIKQHNRACLCPVCKGHGYIELKEIERPHEPVKRPYVRFVPTKAMLEKRKLENLIFSKEDEILELKEQQWRQAKSGLSFDEFLRLNKI